MWVAKFCSRINTSGREALGNSHRWVERAGSFGVSARAVSFVYFQ